VVLYRARPPVEPKLGGDRSSTGSGAGVLSDLGGLGSRAGRRGERNPVSACGLVVALGFKGESRRERGHS
jgi:hypothetical protein